MQISTVTIHGFRGIQHTSARLSNYALVIGPNNAGKSTVLQAIMAFYEKDGFKFDAKRDIPPSSVDDGESWVEIEYSLSAIETDALKDEYKSPDCKLRLRKFFRSNEHASKVGYLHVVDPAGSVLEESFYGAKNVQSGKIGDVIFIPAVSKVDEHTKVSGPSAFRDLVSSIVKDIVATSTAFQDLVQEFDAFSSAIKHHQTGDSRSISGLEGMVNSDLERWGVKFSVDIQHPDEDSIVKNLTSHSFTDTATSRSGMTADNFGSGFQRQFIYTLIKLRAEQRPKKGKSKSKDFAPVMSCVLYEEPEAFLHPPQQDDLARSLRKLAEGDGCQVVCTTHSAHFVSRSSADIPSIVRAGRSADGVISLYQLSLEAWQSIVDANVVINEIVSKYPKAKAKLEDDDFRPEMEAVKHAIWLNPDRCGMFFADIVLIVEGPTEVGIVNRLMSEGKVAASSSGVHVLDAMGKWNIHRFMNLLSAMGVRHSVVFDDDCDRDEHAEINDLIRSASSDFTVSIVALKGDVEILLGVKKCRLPHRKPQHLLFQYDQGAIDSGKIDAFCGIVNGCLSKAVAVGA